MVWLWKPLKQVQSCLQAWSEEDLQSLGASKVLRGCFSPQIWAKCAKLSKARPCHSYASSKASVAPRKFDHPLLRHQTLGLRSKNRMSLSSAQVQPGQFACTWTHSPLPLHRWYWRRRTVSANEPRSLWDSTYWTECDYCWSYLAGPVQRCASDQESGSSCDHWTCWRPPNFSWCSDRQAWASIRKTWANLSPWRCALSAYDCDSVEFVRSSSCWCSSAHN